MANEWIFIAYIYLMILNVFIFNFLRKDQKAWVYDVFVVIPLSGVIIVLVRVFLKTVSLLWRKYARH